MEVDPARVQSFATPAAFGEWLRANHAEAPEIWVKMLKKASGAPSVTWQEAVIEAIAWGWIDGLKKSNDAGSWYQRFTPRRPGSNWSKKNCEYADRLIAEGRMQPPGLAAVTLAKAEGKWDTAYAGQADMKIPADFLAAIAGNPVAKQTFDGLNRSGLFSIYHRLHTARTDKTRRDRMQKIIATLSRGETLG